MQLPLEVNFINLPSSEFLEKSIREKAQKLERFSRQIMSCRVVLEAPHKHHNKGNLYHVRIDITLPGHEIVVNRAPTEHQAHQDAHVAIRDAFNAAARQLEEYMRKQRGQVKTHKTVPHGIIEEVFPDYGVISTSEGREIYFNKNSVQGESFEKLEPGSEVRFSEENGDAGPQASTVQVVGKHHILDEVP